MITLYYDPDCNFCKRWAFRIKKYLAIPELAVLRASDDQRILKEMHNNNSWVILDTQGAMHFRYDGFLVLARASKLLIFIIPLLNLRIARYLGGKIYIIIAKRR